MKYLTAGFTGLIIAIIIIANQGLVPVVFPFFRHIPFGDKLGHFLLMGLFSFLMNLTFKTGVFHLAGIKVLKGSMLVTIVVVLEEISQLFIRSRSFTLSDLVCDLLGIICFGQLAAWVWKKRKGPEASVTQ